MPDGGGINILRAEPKDASTLSTIAQAAKAHWGYPDRWMQAWHYSLTIEPGYIERNEVYLLVQNAEDVGFYGLAGKIPKLDLDHLWVRPAHIGKGYGRLLLEHALRRARELGAESVEIQADPHAEGFYQHMGAERIGEYRYQLDGQERILPKLLIRL